MNDAIDKRVQDIKIAEIICDNPAISYNDLKSMLAKEDLMLRDGLENSISNLIELELITYRSIKDERTFYIKINEDSINNDPNMIKLFQELDESINKFQNTSPKCDQYQVNLGCEAIRHTITVIQRILIDQRKNEQKPTLECHEDYTINEIHKYSCYNIIEGIKHQINRAELIYEQIKNWRNDRSHNLHLANTNNIKSLLPAIIENNYNIKEKNVELNNILEDLEITKINYQYKEFKNLIKNHQTPTDVIQIIKHMRFLKTHIKNIEDSHIAYDSVIQYFRDKLDPIDTNILRKQLLSTKKFFDSDIDANINKAELDMIIFFKDKQMFSLIK